METRSVIRTSPPARSSWISRTLRAVNSDGVVALGPLAIACFARERGIPIEVEFEYLSKALLEFAWEGEIDM